MNFHLFLGVYDGYDGWSTSSGPAGPLQQTCRRRRCCTHRLPHHFSRRYRTSRPWARQPHHPCAGGCGVLVRVCGDAVGLPTSGERPECTRAFFIV